MDETKAQANKRRIQELERIALGEIEVNKVEVEDEVDKKINNMTQESLVKNCPSCSKEIKNDAILCRFCKTHIKEEKDEGLLKKCPVCDEEIQEEAIKCRFCKTYIDEEEEEEEEEILFKTCPFCAEEVKKEALKCKHCGEQFDNNKMGYDYKAEKVGNTAFSFLWTVIKFIFWIFILYWVFQFFLLWFLLS